MNWSCYLIESTADGSYYVGIALNPLARLRAHNAGKGAKRTRSRGPWKLVWAIEGLTHREAAQMECRVKQLPRHEKPTWLVRYQSESN